MDVAVVLLLLGLLCWFAVAAYSSGVKATEAKYDRERQEARTPDWSTRVGQIRRSFTDLMLPGVWILEFTDDLQVLCTSGLKEALSAAYFDGSGYGRKIVYTGNRSGFLEGLTPIEFWTGPAIPDEGIHEKHQSNLALKHKYLFVSREVRQQLEGTPGFENVRFYDA